MNFDFVIFQSVNGLAHKLWLVDWLGIFLAQYLGYILVLGVIILLIQETNWQRRFYFASLSLLSVILARGIVTEVIRFFYYRPRPFAALEITPLISHSLSGSLPSGNAAVFFALGLATFYFFSGAVPKLTKNWGIWFLAAALLMGIGRVFVGVHWPTDIAAGAIAGLLSAFAARKILPKFG